MYKFRKTNIESSVDNIMSSGRWEELISSDEEGDDVENPIKMNKSVIESLFVIKRNNSKELMQVGKIESRISKLLKYPTPLEIEDITYVVQYVVKGINPGTSTSQLDMIAANKCASMATFHPDYAKLAARLVASDLHKRTNSSFSATMLQIHEYGQLMTKSKEARETLSASIVALCKEDGFSRDKLDKLRAAHPEVQESVGVHVRLCEPFVQFVIENAETIDAAIMHDNDYAYSYFGLNTLISKYLFRLNGDVVDRPQYLIYRVAFMVNMDPVTKTADVRSVNETYRQMSQGLYTHATPTLYNSCIVDGSLASCFLMAMESDSIEGIYNTLAKEAIISKVCGGLGTHIHNIRSRGSAIGGTGGRSDGIVPMLRVYNISACYVNQGGKRPGANAIYLEPHHADIREFLKLKRLGGVDTDRTRDLFLALWVSDLFVQRLIDNEPWSLFDPQQCPGLCDVWGSHYVDLYQSYEVMGFAVATVHPNQLLREIYESVIESGAPYFMFKDTCNRKSNQQNLGTIKSSNLCTEVVQYSSPEETATCNLASIALPKCLTPLRGAFVSETGLCFEKTATLFTWKSDEDSLLSGSWVAPVRGVVRVLYDHDIDNYVMEFKGRSPSLDEEIEMREIIFSKQGLRKKISELGPDDPVNSGVFISKEDNGAQHELLLDIVNNGICIQSDDPSQLEDDMINGPGVVYALKRYKLSFDTVYEARDFESIIFACVNDCDVYFDHEKLYDIVRSVVRNVDRLIDNTHYPIPEAEYSNLRHRPMGLGVQGLADVFLALKLPWESEGAKCINREIFETIYYAALCESNALAAEHGPYETFQGSPLQQGKFHFDMCKEKRTLLSGRWDFDALMENIQRHGVRNSLLVAPMPTASTAHILGNNESIEPYTNNMYKRVVTSGEFQVINEHLVKTLIQRDLWSDEMRRKILHGNGSVQHIDEIPNDIKELFKTAWEIPWQTIVDLAADRGVFIDQSQSLNHHIAAPSFETFRDLFITSWKRGLKTGCYYMRTRGASHGMKVSLHTANSSTSSTPNIPESIPVCRLNDPTCDSCGS